MSLMQWLAVGESLKSIEDRPSPYKMRQQNLLPRFGQKSSKGEIAPVARLPLAKRIWCWIREWIFEPWQPIARNVIERFRPSRLSSRKKKRTKAPMQAELLLETVRVIRNDLRDEDLMKAAERSVFAGPRASSGRAGGRIASRIFGSGESVR